LSGEARAYAAATAADEFFTYKGGVDDVRNDRLPVIGVRDRNAPVSMVVWGDSHAMAAMAAFDAFLAERGLSGRQATHPATIPVIGADWDRAGAEWESFGDGNGARIWNDAVLQSIVGNRVPVVVLVAYWRTYIYRFGRQQVETEVLKTVRTLASRGVRVYVMRDVPAQNLSVPNIMAMGGKLGLDVRKFAIGKQEWDEEWGECPAPTEKILAAGGLVLDPRPAMLSSDGKRYALQRDGMPLYRDRHHLTTGGALGVLLPLLRKQIEMPEGGGLKN
jgi:hypothetical protein